jgi:hypothetical protein
LGGVCHLRPAERHAPIYRRLIAQMMKASSNMSAITMAADTPLP